MRFFSVEMYALLSTEDSAHYMIYTVFFYYQIPTSSQYIVASFMWNNISLSIYNISLVYLLPPLLYAIIFTHKYTDGMKQVRLVCGS